MVDEKQVTGMTEDRVNGSVNEAKGKIKEVAGRLVGNEPL
jgi:uncharacterized protein YjbJ (UPF0337 family)